MICPKCQTQIPDDTTFCTACGAQVAGVAAPPPMMPQQPVTVNTWLVPSILVTLCCCLPFGIVSIVFAAKANSCVGRQDYVGAQQAANTAKMWFWLAFGFGLVSNIIWGTIQILAALADNAN